MPSPLDQPAGEVRRLISIRRHVPEEGLAEYDALWGALHAAATEHGAHAWRFRSADVADVYLEFLEFGAETDIRATPSVLAGIQALHRHFGDVYPMPKTIEEWVNVPSAPAPAP